MATLFHLHTKKKNLIKPYNFHNILFDNKKNKFDNILFVQVEQGCQTWHRPTGFKAFYGAAHLAEEEKVYKHRKEFTTGNLVDC